jgi:hypothetical protein
MIIISLSIIENSVSYWNGVFILNGLQPGLSGALFVKQSGTKKRERRTDKAAQII